MLQAIKNFIVGTDIEQTKLLSIIAQTDDWLCIGVEI
jgi:hypothetical protein